MGLGASLRGGDLDEKLDPKRRERCLVEGLRAGEVSGSKADVIKHSASSQARTAGDLIARRWRSPATMLQWRMSKDELRAHHDIGGVAKFMCEPVDREPHALTAFDKEVDAIRQILGRDGVMSVDELRRGIETIPEAEYHRLSYYQRWIRSIAATLLRKGVFTEAELRDAMDRA